MKDGQEPAQKLSHPPSSVLDRPPTPWPLSVLFFKGPLRQQRQQCSPQVRLTPRRTALGNKTPKSKWNSCQSSDFAEKRGYASSGTRNFNLSASQQEEIEK